MSSVESFLESRSSAAGGVALAAGFLSPRGVANVRPIASPSASCSCCSGSPLGVISSGRILTWGAMHLRSSRDDSPMSPGGLIGDNSGRCGLGGRLNSIGTRCWFGVAMTSFCFGLARGPCSCGASCGLIWRFTFRVTHS